MLNANTPRTEAQHEASRLNGSHSQGPTTPDGKARSSQNATKHGLRSSIVVLTNESQEKYNALLTRYKNICRPVGQLEYDQLVNMVDAQWRLRRVKAMATRTLDMEMFQHYGEIDLAFDGTLDPPSRQAQAVMVLAIGNPVSLTYFDRYEERFTRIYTRALTTLLKLQTIRTGLKPTFSFEETNEPETDNNNCEGEETFAYFMPYTGRKPRHNPPGFHPEFPPPVVLSDQPPPEEEAA